MTPNSKSRPRALHLIICLGVTGSLVLPATASPPVVSLGATPGGLTLDAAPAPDSTVALPALAVAGSSTWITVQSPFLGDANRNSYTVYDYATSSSGPWSRVCGNGVPGDLAWRGCTFGGLTANQNYFVRVNFTDPEGVVGANPQVLPVRTLPVAEARAVVGAAVPIVGETGIVVALPLAGDANMNSALARVEIATSSSGPFTQKCGPVAPFAPKLCRIVGLTQGTAYYLQVSVSDPDGVVGVNPQTLGPVNYTGLTDLALGKPITADPGWGCCPNPQQLVDGRIQNPAWYYGFAWAGGAWCWAGGCPTGFKKATIDLGSEQQVGRLVWWTHDPSSVPTTWRVQVSTDGASFTEVFFTTEPRCRTATQPLETAWYNPTCGHVASFGPVSARYVRYLFDDGTLFYGLHGWAVEIEVYAS